MTSTPDSLIVDITRIEAAHLSRLVAQFAELLEEPTSANDPAIGRLVPEAYRDDAEAAAEFRSLTESELLGRRRSDAAVVLASLGSASDLPDDLDDAALVANVEIPLTPPQTQAWLRTLAAVRLVLAERLGIATADDHDPEDPRFGVYEWLGYRLHALVTALEE